jgi:hypothetical protein
MVISFHIKMGSNIEQWTSPAFEISAKGSIMMHGSTAGVSRLYGVGEISKELDQKGY